MKPFWLAINYLFKPTVEPMNIRVAICVGHSRFISGRRDGGALSAGNVQEWNYNKELAITLKDKLLEESIPCFIVDHYHGNGYTDSMKWLASHLEAEKATHAIELHFNAANGNARGHEWLYWHSSSTGQKMAVALSGKFKEWFSALPARGAKAKSAGDRGGEFLRLTRCPAVIAEPFFGDNEADWKFATENEYAIAGAIAQALKETIV